MSDIERTSLEAHVSLCELRYQALNDRLNRVELSLVDLEESIQEIRDLLMAQQDRSWSKWDQVQLAVIGVLTGIVAFFAARLLGL